MKYSRFPKMLSFSVSTDDYEKLKNLAESKKVAFSEFLRLALRKALLREKDTTGGNKENELTK